MVCGKMSSRGAKGLKVLKKQNARKAKAKADKKKKAEKRKKRGEKRGDSGRIGVTNRDRQQEGENPARRGENNGKKTPGTEEVPDEAPVKIMVAQFLDVVGDSVTIEKALFYLKKKDFDIEAAISLYLTTQSTTEDTANSDDDAAKETGADTDVIFSSDSFPVDGELSGEEKSKLKSVVDILGDSVTMEKAIFYLKECNFDADRAVSLYFTRQSEVEDGGSSADEALKRDKLEMLDHITDSDDDSDTDLIDAVVVGDEALVRILVESKRTASHTLDWMQYLRKKGENGKDAFETAVELNLTGIVKLLHEEGAVNLNAETPSDENQYVTSCLVSAASNDRLQMVKYLVEHGALWQTNSAVLEAAVGESREYLQSIRSISDPPPTVEQEEEETPMAVHENQLRFIPKGNIAPFEVEGPLSPTASTDGNQRQRGNLLALLCSCAVGFIMLVVMLPLSFSYVELTQHGIFVERYSRAVSYGGKVFPPGRYFNGLVRDMVVFPKRSIITYLNDTSVRTIDGLMFSIDFALQYRLKTETLYDMMLEHGNLETLDLHPYMGTLVQSRANEVMSKHSGTKVLTDRELLTAELQSEITKEIEGRGFDVVNVFVLNMDPPGKELDLKLEAILLLKLEETLKKEELKLESIVAETRRMVEYKETNLSAYVALHGVEREIIEASLEKSRLGIFYKTLFKTTLIQNQNLNARSVYEKQTEVLNAVKELQVALAEEKRESKVLHTRIPYMVSKAQYESFLQNISATVQKEVSNRIQRTVATGIVTRSKATKSSLKAFDAALGETKYNGESALGIEWIDAVVNQAQKGIAFDRYTPKKLVGK